MDKSVSDKNTKAQILEAYEKLLKEVEEKTGNTQRGATAQNRSPDSAASH